MEKGEQSARQHYRGLMPLVQSLLQMIDAARQAFNRHSQAQLEEMARLRRGLYPGRGPLLRAGGGRG